MILLIAIVVITQSFGTQGVIDIVQEDVICTVYSEEYFTEPDAFVDEQNGMFVNFTMIKQLPIEAQGGLDIVVEDANCPFYDKEYFTEPETFITDQNSLVVNITIIKSLPIEAQGHLALIGASMGEYVVSTGIDQEMDMCDILQEPIMTGPLFKVLGFSEDDCPPEVGVYGTEGYVIPTDTLPDGFPPNKYMVNTTLSYDEKPLLVCQMFANVQ
ncbi:uncharacterized protein LOC130670621 [Microplitis mediator]|uniref:uncharacterized protein LOC130670621 n=1 Tax=Microplitis mediator TaxID=375433 RepID=UPI00255448A5|nr:uncharacterized protein LOC130670621 [Microplitis mediator]